MAFYDNLKDKISKTGQDAIQKTRNIADTTKLNMTNNEIEKSNKELYEKIGRIYFEKYQNTIDDADILELTNQLLSNQGQIKANTDQIHAMKGVQSCPGCGAEVAKGIKFCAKCGTKVPEWVEPQVTTYDSKNRPVGDFCTSCGVYMLDGVCPVCGKKAQ